MDRAEVKSARRRDQNPGIALSLPRRRNRSETLFGAKNRTIQARKHIVNDAAIAWQHFCASSAPARIRAMTYRVASDVAGSILADARAKEFLPHLVCSWTLDPASHRLSCAWAAPMDRWDIALLSARIATSTLSPGAALAKSRAS
jgi:hypothetical protein